MIFTILLFVIFPMNTIWGFVSQKTIENRNYQNRWAWFFAGFFCGAFGYLGALMMPEKKTEYESNRYSAGKTTNDPETLSNGGWKCEKCGRVNPMYTGTCACGNRKI